MNASLLSLILWKVSSTSLRSASDPKQSTKAERKRVRGEVQTPAYSDSGDPSLIPSPSQTSNPISPHWNFLSTFEPKSCWIRIAAGGSYATSDNFFHIIPEHRQFVLWLLGFDEKGRLRSSASQSFAFLLSRAWLRSSEVWGKWIYGDPPPWLLYSNT